MRRENNDLDVVISSVTYKRNNQGKDVLHFFVVVIHFDTQMRNPPQKKQTTHTPATTDFA
jgi:hypothetical protein